MEEARKRTLESDAARAAELKARSAPGRPANGAQHEDDSVSSTSGASTERSHQSAAPAAQGRMEGPGKPLVPPRTLESGTSSGLLCTLSWCHEQASSLTGVCFHAWVQQLVYWTQTIGSHGSQVTHLLEKAWQVTWAGKVQQAIGFLHRLDGLAVMRHEV